MRPCIDLDYIVGKDTFSFGTPDEVSQSAGCLAGEGTMVIQIGRNFEYEMVEKLLCFIFIVIYPLQEDYIIKSVDLLSGFGGTMGLWLGWSVMSLGELIIQTFKTLKTIMSFQ